MKDAKLPQHPWGKIKIPQQVLNAQEDAFLFSDNYESCKTSPTAMGKNRKFPSIHKYTGGRHSLFRKSQKSQNFYGEKKIPQNHGVKLVFPNWYKIHRRTTFCFQNVAKLPQRPLGKNWDNIEFFAPKTIVI